MQKYRILIVDDIEENRFTLDTILSMLGDFDVDEAEDGPQALERIAAKTYDLVFLDIMMPGMTGLEVLENLDLARTETPLNIIVVSALTDMETIVKGLELGALDYLPKPIEEPLLAARMKQLLDRRETDALLEQHRTRIETDLRKAAEIQRSLCPQESLSVPGSGGIRRCDLAGIIAPAFEVGGDFYDYFTLPSGRIVLVMGDACGKGAPAAIYAARVRDLVRLFSHTVAVDAAAEPGTFVRAVLGGVNGILAHNNEDCWFVTIWLGIADPATGRLTYASAGHCEALLQSPGGAIDTLTCAVGLPVGIDEMFEVEPSQTTLGPGHTLHVYSDGATENMTASGAFLGLDGFTGLIRTLYDPAVQKVSLDALAAAIRDVNVEARPEDDVTIMALSVM